MSAAGDSVDAIDANLRAIVAAYGVEHVEVAVLPTSLMVSTGHGTATQIEIGIPPGTGLRFDQVAELYALVRVVSSAEIPPHEALDRLAAIYRMPPTFGWPVRVLGHAVLTVGLALLLQPTVGAVGAAFVLGLLVGLAKLPRLATLEIVFPVVVSFAVSVVVFATLQQVQIDNPVRILIPPLSRVDSARELRRLGTDVHVIGPCNGPPRHPASCPRDRASSGTPTDRSHPSPPTPPRAPDGGSDPDDRAARRASARTGGAGPVSEHVDRVRRSHGGDVPRVRGAAAPMEPARAERSHVRA